MTISASRTRELDINRICALAFQIAGLMNPNESTTAPQFSAKLATAMDFLDTICKRIQSYVRMERHTTRATAAVTATVATANLSSSANSVVGDLMFKATGSDVETPVVQISLETYHAIMDKASVGTPVQAYISRQPTPVATLWQVPSESGTLAYLQHVLAADVSVGSETVDFERHWTAYLMWELAAWLSMGAGGAKQRAIQEKADNLLAEAASYSASQRPIQLRVVHSGGR
jgi:hypothetical protein